jgi:hypothetical protein
MIGRKKDNFDAAGGNAALDLAYNDKSGALKVLGPTMGHLILLGALNNGVLVGLGSMVQVFNSDTVVHYVSTGASGAGAPSSPANGIPVPPGQYITISTGPDQQIRSDSSTVYGYLVDDETTYSPQVAP